MTNLGIEIKGSTIICICLKDGQISDFPNKIELSDSYDSQSLRQIYNQLTELFLQVNVEKIVIKKRLEKGKFAGGAASFKLEGLIQLATEVDVKFISSTQINAFQKKTEVDLAAVKKYQEQAYLAALTLEK